MIVALALAADLRTLQIGDYSETRLRVDSGPIVGVDATTAPFATLAMAAPRWRLSLSYQPYVGVTDIEAPKPEAIYYNSGVFNAAWWNRTVSLGVSETATYGKLNTSSLLSQQAAPGMAQQVNNGIPIGEVSYAGSISSANVTYTPTRYWTFDARGGYSAYGGLTQTDRAVLAFQRGPTADLQVTHSFTPEDAAFVRLDGTRTETLVGPCFGEETIIAGDCAPDSYIASAIVGVRRAMSPTTQLSIGGGAGLVRARLNPDIIYHTTYYPVLAASYEYRFVREEHRVVFRADADIAPFVDTRTGAVDDRAQLTGTGTWILGKYTASGYFGVAQTIEKVEIQPTTIVFATARLDDHLTRNVMLTLSLSYFFQHQDGVDDISSAIAEAGITVMTSPWRF
jgi:hypothetical protein